jgi:ABC-type sugar transport system permease subunit
MFLYLTFAFIILIIPNFMLIKRSKRKKRFGLFPLRISLVLFGVLLVFAGVVKFSLHSTSQPSLTGYARGAHATDRFEDARNEYERNKADDDDRKQAIAPYFSMAFIVVRIQLCIALGFSLFALLTISGRNNFYYAMLLTNALGILATIMLDTGWN